jgi:hypothetical protein
MQTRCAPLLCSIIAWKAARNMEPFLADHRRIAHGGAERSAPADALISLLAIKATMLAVRVGVFEALRDHPSSAANLAAHLGVNAEVLELILDVLLGAGYLAREDELYALTSAARGALLTDSARGCRNFLQFTEDLWGLIGRMDEALAMQDGLDFHAVLTSNDQWAVYQRAMLEDAKACVPLVAALVPVRPGAERLLDIGGSHGLYGARLCREYPPMKSIVFELPCACEESIALARSEGLQDLVTHRAADVLQADLGIDNDVVLISNFLHHLPRQSVIELVHRIRPVMSAGGTIAIWEWCGREAASGASDAKLDSMALFFRAFSHGRLWSATSYAEWLAEAGFENVRIRSVPAMRHRKMITAQVPYR